MSAVRMDGKMVSAKVRGSILEEVNGLKEKGVRPGLAVIIVGEDPASKVYVRNKERACEVRFLFGKVCSAGRNHAGGAARFD